MPPRPIASNTLFYGDNLDILREYIADETVDLIYLDPPFNSSRNYNVLFKDESGKDSEAQIAAFEDTWHWNADVERAYSELVTGAPERVGQMIGALRQIVGHTSPMMAYLVMMAARLVELHRVLKPTGSLYLHCDPTASHYLKVILDTIFDPRNFRNEVIWRRTRAHNDQKITRFGAVHDTVLFYSKGNGWTFNKIFTARSETAPKTHDLYRHTDGKLYRKGDCLAPGGRGPRYEWHGHVENWRFTEEEARRLEAEGRIVYTKSGMPRILRPVDPDRGSPLQDVWADIDAPNSGSAEILGYPTQKPLALLERIIAASSNAGDLVLDPFCGCGTAVAAAQKLGRRWIGIDITHLSIALQKYRLAQMFPGIAFNVIGEPLDVGAAAQLAQDDRYQFQWWALSLIRARPLGGDGGKTGKKGSDKGIDGVITFIDDATAKPKRLLVQVKSGHVRSGDVRDLRGTLEREGAAIGTFITLEPPSRDMRAEAASAGYYRSPGWGRDYPKIQILPIADLLQGAQLQMPPAEWGTFKQAQRVAQADGEQLGFDVG
jgi:site-specific DNA-methyltransferase (adenine-specific)